MVKCNNCKNLETKDNGFDAYSWCEKINDCPHGDIERDCEHYVPMINADRIRSMTDKELAEMLSVVSQHCVVYLSDHIDCRHSRCESSCKSNIKKWLQKESEE